MGLEVHLQLATKSKIFSGAANQFGAEPNVQACAVDLGMPGMLPVLNSEAVRYAVMFGLAIDARLGKRSVFDRKITSIQTFQRGIRSVNFLSLSFAKVNSIFPWRMAHYFPFELPVLTSKKMLENLSTMLIPDKRELI
jgi:aspartyl-tRNA(Asn)/glutamyl-tRNA(Gln) amidotransferase subunit B